MMSSAPTTRARKPPAERRAEIVAAAAAIALDDGLEGITLRAVADRLGVRPGLISHYFPVAEDLVIAAFVHAVSDERETLVPEGGEPLERMARLVSRVESPGARPISRLWLNARHLSRFRPALDDALEEQESLDRAKLTELVEEGIAAGVFACDDALVACVRIFIAIDGFGAYANNTGTFTPDAYARFVTDAAEWALGLEPGRLRAAVAALAD
ncbi:TetR/AcrR family transcriptional regulator [Agromyces endophyticus]|uniref:TetR/AcrR family transcriptional regulator n=1 Tax=Agromyces sp. H17E-10 TaxID=2932244 RepID=UPI001FD5A01C|nr:TetR/AcrR family transcriptional regulator [Agromyces sp. H17E-10]UOQ90117.1 TetR/AcrR family transcriptional regulator [Agromyces sp. H17E-10]